MKAFLTKQMNAHLARQLARRWAKKTTQTSVPSAVSRMLVIELGGLGDAVHLLPVLGALQARFANAQLSVVCRDYVKGLFDLFDGGKPLDKVVGIPKSTAGVLTATKQLGNVPWDLVVSTCWSTWATSLALNLRARALTGFWSVRKVESFGFMPLQTPVPTEHDHLQMLRFKSVAPLGIATPSAPVVPAILPRDSDWKEVTLRYPWLMSGFCALIPLCADSSKSLRLSEAAVAFCEARKLEETILLLGGETESAGLERIAGWVQRMETRSFKSARHRELKPPPFVLSTLTVPQLTAVLAHARLVISVDTGALHLAAAIGRPTVGIFLSTDPDRCGPIGKRTLAIRREELRAGCWKQSVRGWIADAD